MLKMYTAVKIKSDLAEFSDGHLTLSFSDIKETDKLSFEKLSEFFPSKAIIEKIEFFENAGVTVAIINSVEIFKAYNYLNSVGLIYNMEFKPHVTLSYSGKNESSHFFHLIEKEIILSDVYLKIKNFKKG